MQNQQPPRLSEGTPLEQLKALREEAIEYQVKLQGQLSQLAQRRVMLDEQITAMEAGQLALPLVALTTPQLWRP